MKNLALALTIALASLSAQASNNYRWSVGASEAESRGWLEGDGAKEVWDFLKAAGFFKTVSQKGVELVSKNFVDAECSYQERAQDVRNSVLICGRQTLTGFEASKMMGALRGSHILRYIGMKRISSQNLSVSSFLLPHDSCQFGAVTGAASEQYIACK